MASLRSMLGKFSDMSVPIQTSLTATQNITRAPVGCQIVFSQSCGWNNNNGNYNDGCTCWNVPPGVTWVQFELWGSGGGGPGGCCCQQGTPGGAGAYAKKTICGTNLSCCPYWLFSAPPASCSVSCAGCNGNTTWACGYGLSNFCAEGGKGGAACCYVMWSLYPVSASTTCGNIYLPNQCMTCACYYGADSGALGRPSYLWSQCGQAGPCYWKAGIAYPGGLVNTSGGYMMVNFMGNACCNQQMYYSAMNGWAGDSEYMPMPGMGGMNSTSCGSNGCCYGGPGNPGMIRITFR